MRPMATVKMIHEKMAISRMFFACRKRVETTLQNGAETNSTKGLQEKKRTAWYVSSITGYSTLDTVITSENHLSMRFNFFIAPQRQTSDDTLSLSSQSGSISFYGIALASISSISYRKPMRMPQ